MARKLELMHNIKARLHASDNCDVDAAHVQPWEPNNTPQGCHDPKALAELSLLEIGDVALRALNPGDVSNLKQKHTILAKSPLSQATVRMATDFFDRQFA